MIYQDYFDSVGEAIEFLIALGGVISVFLVILGILWGALGGRRQMKSAIILVVIGGIIWALTGGYEVGLKYFHIFR